MKMSIQWHKECLKRQKNYIRLKTIAAIDVAKSIQRDLEEMRFYELQIQEARRLKKDGFNSEKFLKKRKVK
jgi:hypothetical protein